MASGASRLFHTIVVVGASMGCGASTAVDSRGSAADASAADDSTSPIDSEASPGDAGPKTICDCARPGAFRCGACASGTPPVHGRCTANDGVGCACDESIPIAAPIDCANPEQFVCALSPDFDASLSADGFWFGSIAWYAFADCWCDTTRPITASQCTDERNNLRCVNGYGCPPTSSASEAGLVSVGDGASYAVRYACACLPPPVPIL